MKACHQSSVLQADDDSQPLNGLDCKPATESGGSTDLKRRDARIARSCLSGMATTKVGNTALKDRQGL